MDFQPHHHHPYSDTVTYVICVLSGLAATVYGFLTNAIHVSPEIRMDSFYASIQYAAVGATTAFFVTKFLNHGWNKLSDKVNTLLGRNKNREEK